MGEDGACCKHVVAAGLAWLADRDDAGRNDQDETDDNALIRNYLLKQNKATLADTGCWRNAIRRKRCITISRAGRCEACRLWISSR